MSFSDLTASRKLVVDEATSPECDFRAQGLVELSTTKTDRPSQFITMEVPS
jgi:hypothetical protein